MSEQRTAVVGAGRMGTGIAHGLLLAGAHVTLVDSTDAYVARGVEAVRRMTGRSVDKGATDGTVDEIMGRLSGATAAQGPFDLVVEAVPEDPALKLDVLSSLEPQVREGGLLASNTSSISIDELAAGLRAPARFLGMHFFNPVPASSLVEVVRGSATDQDAVAAARGWVEAMGKTGIVVADSPGFASSRLGVAIGLEAIRMLAEGVASPEDIDQAMVLGYRFPIGPLRLTDLVGLDVRLGIAEYLASTLGERFEPPALMREMVARGELGQKSGRGFYTWDD
ncbi:3-hydroxyacyl-CoA dehydrogenase family protein [Acrocarpospora catenulata]|uniref:3-hydroxyacyl-CoA dehydrogenase family protein n=1 Tax=Acrocarpospora catenulata TaxID=2836182 RepID=UPI0027E19BE5|nr:3-hydroxyacyl-CoA dehydrogenase family protein [Acrocarpospora catenulata]